jgi:hypothetical protein
VRKDEEGGLGGRRGPEQEMLSLRALMLLKTARAKGLAVLMLT